MTTTSDQASTTSPDAAQKGTPGSGDNNGDEEGRRFRTPWAWWKSKPKRKRRIIVAIIMLPPLLLIAAAGIFYASVDVPLPQSINTAEVSTVTYRDGKTEILKIGSINRTNVPLSKVSLAAQHAVLAAEDKNFYSESGISYTGILRALWADIRGQEITQGGSTITQQYAKNAYLSSERSFTRKLKEIVIAMKLDKKYSKDQILEYYLNTIYLGRGSYGIEAAAQTYFGVPASKLTAAQGALLAGLIRAPSVLDPRINPSAAETRFGQVIDAMASKNWIDPGEAADAKLPPTLPLQTTGPNAPRSPQDAYIRDAVVRELEAKGISEDEITRGGLHITTTLDPVAQLSAINAVNASFGATPPDVQPAVVAIQPGTGEVRAWYGGRFYGKGPGGFSDYVDNVTDPVQPGSSFKPIALAAALKQGISLNSYYNGNSHQVITRDYPQGVPNYAGESVGQINLLQATAMSINSVFVPLAIDAGRENVIQMGHDLGIPASEKLPAVDSLPLGVADTRPLDMTNVYATFAAQGVEAQAHLVTKVTDHNGDVIYEAPKKTKRVLDPSVAADQTYALQQPFLYGTAAGLSPGRPVAGKTGTTDNNVSAWLCGYTPQLASCVAVSRANHHQSLNGIFNTATEATGASTAGHAWQMFMAGALANQPVLPFPPPAFGGTTRSGHAPPPPPPPPTTQAPRQSHKPTPRPTTKQAPTAAPQPNPPAPSPTPAPSSGGGLLGGVLGNGGTTSGGGNSSSGPGNSGGSGPSP